MILSKYLNTHIENKTHWKIVNKFKNINVVYYLCTFLDIIATFFKGFRYYTMISYLMFGKYPSLTFTLADIDATSTATNLNNISHPSRSIILRYLLDSIPEIVNFLSIKGFSSLISFVSQSSLNYSTYFNSFLKIYAACAD